MVQLVRKYTTFYSNVEDAFIPVEKNSDFYNVSGIYMIKCEISNDVYIGQSKSIGYRLTSHRSLLRSNKHLYKNNMFDILQKSWNKYGEQNFKFFIVQVCSNNLLNINEEYWIKYYNCNRSQSGTGFNLTNGGDQPPHGSYNKGRIHVVDATGTIEKVIKADELQEYINMGYMPGIANKEKRADKAYQTRIKNGTNVSPMKGKKHSDEWKTNQSENLSNRKCIQKDGLIKYVKMADLQLFINAGWVVGRAPYKNRKPKDQCNYRTGPLPAYAKQKISESKYKPVLYLTIDGQIIKEYPHIGEVIQDTGIKKSIIYRMLRGMIKNLDKYNYRFKYKE